MLIYVRHVCTVISEKDFAQEIDEMCPNLENLDMSLMCMSDQVKSNEFDCWAWWLNTECTGHMSGQCVGKNVFCDGIYNCVDRSDETGCKYEQVNYVCTHAIISQELKDSNWKMLQISKDIEILIMINYNCPRYNLIFQIISIDII